MTEERSQRPWRVGLVSLGCAKNLVDAEIMLGSLLQAGLIITNDAAGADAVIINTCSFIDAAQEESVEAILESVAVREAKNRGQAVIVAGCLPQRFREELPKLLPEVDAFLGIDQVTQVGEIVGRAIAGRASKISNPQPRLSRRTVVSRLNELEKSSAASGQEKPRSLPGMGKSGGNRMVHAPPAPPATGRSPAPAAPIWEVHARPTFIPDFATPRFRLTPRHFAYVKIAEGCNHPCSFCTIPRMRGSHRSRPQADIVAEAKALIAEGVKELNLISQDSTYYGLDLRPKPQRSAGGAIFSPEKFSAAVKSLPADAPTLCTLLRELDALEGDFWIRLLYTHPAHWTEELIETMAGCKKVARYVDIPLQHIHENMLERMRRETSRKYIVDLIRKIRAGIPGIALRTTFIVGFPGETEAIFEELLDFIRETKFERLGVFTYSPEAGTRAAAMSGQVPDAVKQHRRDRAMAVQRQIAREISRSFVGRQIKVLVEGRVEAPPQRTFNGSSWEHGWLRGGDSVPPPKLKSEGRWYLTARSEADAPDIDGHVLIRGKLPLGEFARVKIIGHGDYDLLGEAV
ncbi:MAG TPA: 30S ribosomal protein S12 methylthiotransferase RimO [Verrucomicrobiae bacterium]|nr:30S ribosomal protein S12 methylthiotransferase RimO [Verrucomicrobiae bacterium]